MAVRRLFNFKLRRGDHLQPTPHHCFTHITRVSAAQDTMATSLVVPVAYITVLVTGLAIFSRIYRRRRLGQSCSLPLVPLDPTPPSPLVASSFLLTPASREDIIRAVVPLSPAT